LGFTVLFFFAEWPEKARAKPRCFCFGKFADGLTLVLYTACRSGCIQRKWFFPSVSLLPLSRSAFSGPVRAMSPPPPPPANTSTPPNVLPRPLLLISSSTSSRSPPASNDFFLDFRGKPLHHVHFSTSSHMDLFLDSSSDVWNSAKRFSYAEVRSS